MTRQKVVLAYSGGLDTSVLVRILTDEYGYDVIACHADVGESKDHEKLREKARKAGAVATEIDPASHQSVLGTAGGDGAVGGADPRRGHEPVVAGPETVIQGPLEQGLGDGAPTNVPVANEDDLRHRQE